MEEQLLKEHHVLLLGVLKTCHITGQHPLFEDYLQLARIKFIETYRDWKKEQEDLEGFPSYVFTRLRWYLTDLQRQEMKRLVTDDISIMTETDLTQAGLVDFAEDLATNDLLEKLLSISTEQETFFLVDVLYHQLTVTDIAKKHHVSRQTVYNWKQSLQKKYRLISKTS